MNMKNTILGRKTLLYGSVFLSIICIFLITILISEQEYLVLVDRDTDEELYSREIKNHDRFSLTYTHSVEQSEVTEVFEVIDGRIYVMESHTESFGAGLPYEGTVLNDDGKYVIKDIEVEIQVLTVRPSNVYPHYFTYKTDNITISEPPFKDRNIEIKVK